MITAGCFHLFRTCHAVELKRVAHHMSLEHETASIPVTRQRCSWLQLDALQPHETIQKVK